MYIITFEIVNKRKNKKYHTVGTFSKSNGKTVETETKLIPLTHMHMTAHFPGWYRQLQ
jgi:hypothetical protein